MNTNVPITLTDSERQLLAAFLDGKPTKRLATRKNIIDYLQGVMAGTLAAESFDQVDPEPGTPAAAVKGVTVGERPSRLPDGVYLDQPNGDPALIDKPAGYCRGWNKVKYGLGSAA